MTSPLGGTDAYKGKEVDDDYVPSKGIQGIQEAVIVGNHIVQYDGGTRYMIIEYKVGNRNYRERQMIVSSKGTNYYVTKAGNKAFLAGYNIINAVCLLAVGKTLADLDSSFKMKKMKLWDNSVKKDVMQKALTCTKLNGKSVWIGFRTIVVDKPKVKKGKKQYANGKPVPSGEYQQYDSIFKYFNKKHLTISEITTGSKKPLFAKNYMKEFGKGEVIDLTKDHAFSKKSGKKSKSKKKAEKDVFAFPDKKGNSKKKKKGKKPKKVTKPKKTKQTKKPKKSKKSKKSKK